MGRGLLSRKPVETRRHSFALTNVTTSAWVEVISAMTWPSSSVEIFNSGGRILILSTGTAGNEDDDILDYTIIPGGSEILVPSEFARGSRVSIKAIDANSTTGWLIFNFFG